MVLPDPAGTRETFCKDPASPHGHCPTASWGQRGHIAWQHVSAAWLCPHRRHMGPWGACHKAERDKTGLGCVGVGSHSLCCPQGHGTPMRTAGWLEGCCCGGMGTAGGRGQLRMSPEHLSGAGCLSPGGSTVGLELQSSALLSVGIQRAQSPWELPCDVCQSSTSPWPGHSSSCRAVQTLGTCARCWLWSCASTL